MTKKDVKKKNYDNIKNKEMIKRGKDGKIFPVGKDCIKKVFRLNKNPREILKECEFQRKAADFGIAPPIVEVKTDKDGRYHVVMQRLHHTLMDEIRKENDLNIKWQKEMVKILKKLDKLRVFHGDISPLNFMVNQNDNKLYIIDFGMSQKIDAKFIKKFGRHPNVTMGITAFILRLREFVPGFSPSILQNEVFKNKIEI